MKLVPLLTVIAASMLHAADKPEPKFDKVDHEIVIGTVHGKLMFSETEFTVKPGSKVKLTLRNDDAMLHNLVIVNGGKREVNQIATEAIQLGAKALEKHFVPDNPSILAHTTIVNPTESSSIYFVAPTETGPYPYVCTLPGHVATMQGVMQVSNYAGSSTGLTNLTYKYYEGDWTVLPDFSKLKPAASGPAKLIDISKAKKSDGFAFLFEGTFNAPSAGEYEFATAADDGVRLTVGGQVVINDDGIHGPQTKKGKIKLGERPVPFNVAYFEASGGQSLSVSYAKVGGKQVSLSSNKKQSGSSKQIRRGIELVVSDKALVNRVFVHDATARSIAVGLPNGVNYMFDAEHAFVQFGWLGKYVDVQGDRGGRGGGLCHILGERFEVGSVGHPLRIGNPDLTPSVRFGGYARTGTPRFFFTVNGVEVVQTVTGKPNEPTLTYHFELKGVKDDVYFNALAAGLSLSASAGTWSGGVLKVPAKDAAKFSVTVSVK